MCKSPLLEKTKSLLGTKAGWKYVVKQTALYLFGEAVVVLIALLFTNLIMLIFEKF